MDAVLRILQQCMLFRDISPEIIGAYILPAGSLREISKGQHLISLWESVDFFGIVISGQFQTMQIFADGTYSICDVLGPGEVIGADLIWTRSRTAPYYAIAPQAAQVLLLPNRMVKQPGMLPEAHRRQITDKLLTLVSHDNIRKEYRLAILAQKGLRQRILTYLTMQANKRQTASFTIPFSREELASYLCVNRSALSHELSLMQQEGLLTFSKNRFTLSCWDDPHSEPTINKRE